MGTSSPGERLLGVNGVELCVQSFGRRSDPTLLLIAGAAASMLWWDARLCERIAAGGRQVVRFDQRDTGRSTSYPVGAPGYSYTDLARDALELLNALGIERAHLVCQSWSCGIGLLLAGTHSDRVASLTLVSGSTGEPGLPGPSTSGVSVAPSPDHDDVDALVEAVVAESRACAGTSPYFNEPTVRALARRDVRRARSYGSTLVNHYAIEVVVPSDLIPAITVPTLIIHGDQDPILPLEHGEALRDAVNGAEMVVVEGAGHDLPPQLWDVVVSALLRHTAAVGA